MTKQPTKPTYEELAQAVLMFHNNEAHDLWVHFSNETWEALTDCGERLEANQEVAQSRSCAAAPVFGQPFGVQCPEININKQR